MKISQPFLDALHDSLINELSDHFEIENTKAVEDFICDVIIDLKDNFFDLVED
jgi:hypothetical protein